MKDLLDYIKSIPSDKLLHWVFAKEVTLGVTILSFFIVSPWFAPLLGFTSGVIISALKEVYDKLSGDGVCELNDFIWSTVSCLVMTIEVYLILLILL